MNGIQLPVKKLFGTKDPLFIRDRLAGLSEWTDIVLSTGEGKPRELEARTMVFKRSPESTYVLKMKAARTLLTEVNRRFQFMPFTLRSACVGDENTAKMGITEMVRHGVVQPFPVLFEKEGAAVAHVKFTVLLLPNGSLKVAGGAMPDYVHSDKARALPADIAAVLAQEPYVSKAASKKAKAAAAAPKADEDVEMS
jgi:hypothetical protein